LLGISEPTISLEHFPAKWEPVRRRKCDHLRTTRANSDSIGSEFAPGWPPCRFSHARSFNSVQLSGPLFRVCASVTESQLTPVKCASL
jgi:hypothetical protein